MTASSGSMLVLLYSDTNYVMSGFSASFTVNRCPASCSGHGRCDEESGLCECEPSFSGEDCGLPLCPDNCGSGADWGHCQGDRCRCSPDFVGDDCSFNDKVEMIVQLVTLHNSLQIIRTMSAIPGRWSRGRVPADCLPALSTPQSMMMSMTLSMFMAGQISMMFLRTL